VTSHELQEIEATGTLKTGDKALAELRKRKLAIQKCVSMLHTMLISINGFRKFLWFTVHKGQNFSLSLEKLETDLTVEMLTSCVYRPLLFFEVN
jgi:phenylalanyl-tRNA synthetase alpha chain